MAHSDTIRARLRALYVYDRLPLERAAAHLGVAPGTASRWKKAAKQSGDDWDKHRAASLLAGGGVEDVARQMLADYVIQHKTLMESIAGDGETNAAAKVDMLASLADSFTKTVAASRRVLPETVMVVFAVQFVKICHMVPQVKEVRRLVDYGPLGWCSWHSVLPSAPYTRKSDSPDKSLSPI